MSEFWSSYSYVHDLRLQGYDLHSNVKHQHFGETCCSPRSVYTLRLRCQDPQIISNYLPLDMVSYPENLHLQHSCLSFKVLSLLQVLNEDMHLLKHIHDYFQHQTWQYLVLHVQSPAMIFMYCPICKSDSSTTKNKGKQNVAAMH